MKYEQLTGAVVRCLRADMPVWLWGPPGIGKCLGRGTPVLMYDGTVKAVERVEAGELLMGPDSTPRTVLSVNSGISPLYRVTPTKGDPYTVNDAHILSLRASPTTGQRAFPFPINISVTQYLSLAKSARHHLKGWRSPLIEWPKAEVSIPPYLVGLWLGDGNSTGSRFTSADAVIHEEIRAYATANGMSLRLTESRSAAMELSLSHTGGGSRATGPNPFTVGLLGYDLVGNKHIPHGYLVTDERSRLELLAGLIDTDGHYICGCYEITQKRQELAEQILFLARSLGFAAYLRVSMKKSQVSELRPYHRVTISGDISRIPVKLPHKRAKVREQKKNVRLTGIKVDAIGEGEYFGFTLDGDHLFLLGDFTVTHNTALVHDNIAKAINLPVWDFRINSKEPVDLRGLPGISEVDGRKVTTWIAPEDLPIEPALMFFDEANTAAVSMQAPCYQVVQEKRLGNWKAHPDTRIIAAGNREKDRAIANKLSSAFSTRFGHFDLEVDSEQWCQWASRSGRISPEMIAFIHMKPQNLHNFQPDMRTSPIPRTVEAADRVWRQDPPEATAHEELAAHVGEGFATEFIAFVALRHKMPDIADILRRPDKVPAPEGKDGMSIRFLVASLLAQRMSRDNMAACCIYLDRLGEEFSVFAMKDALARDKTLVEDGKGRANPVFIKWGSQHADLLG